MPKKRQKEREMKMTFPRLGKDVIKNLKNNALDMLDKWLAEGEIGETQYDYLATYIEENW